MKLGLKNSGRRTVWDRALSDLVLPNTPWTAENLLRAYVEQVRGRQLIISRDSGMAYPGGPSGMWLSGRHADLVWAHPAATGVQLEQVYGHELGHMVNGDEAKPLDLTEMMRLLMNACSHTSGLWQSLMNNRAAVCRAGDTSTEERERQAEAFGYYAARWAVKNGPQDESLLVKNMRDSLA
ncbi:hypothetical protein ACPCSE_29570 [Streptomyces cellulosae]